MKEIIEITQDGEPCKCANCWMTPYRAKCAGYTWNFKSRCTRTHEELQKDAVEALSIMVFAGRGPGLMEYSIGWHKVEKLTTGYAKPGEAKQ